MQSEAMTPSRQPALAANCGAPGAAAGKQGAEGRQAGVN